MEPDAAPNAPEWLQTPGALPPGARPGYLSYLEPDEGSRPETLDNFPPPSRRRRNRLLATGTVVAVALLAAVAIFVTREAGGKTGSTPSPTPAGSRAAGSARSPVPASRAPASQGLVSQGRISAALIFPHAHVVADGLRFSRVTAVVDEQCSAAARSAFAAALKSAGCQRVVRATFVDSARRYAVTAGVAELPSPAAASSADRSRKFGQDVWFTGLDGPAKSGATAVSQSVGVGYDAVYGRYIVYAFATNSDGRNPTGHTGQVRTLKSLAKFFTVLARQPLIPAK